MDIKLKKDFSVISKEENKAKVKIIYNDNSSEIVEYPIVSPNELRSMIKSGGNILINKKYIEGFSYKDFCPDKKTALNNFNAEDSIIDGNLDFSDAIFHGPVSFSKALINSGFVNFERAVFKHGTVVFNDVSFGDGRVSFEYVSFGEGTVSFRGARFGEGGASFSHALFGNGFVGFDDVTFAGGKTLFRETLFGDGDVSFQHAKFGNNETSFRWAKFGKGDVFFDWVSFGQSEVSFETTTFGEGKVSFASSKFNGRKVSFGYSTFGNGNTDFSHVEFDGKVIYEHVRFGKGEVSFKNATFAGEKANFNYAIFGEGDVSFADAKFKNCEIFFENTIFGNGNVLFSNTKLRNARIYFKNASFANSIDQKIIFSELKTDEDSSHSSIAFVECVFLLSLVLYITRITEVSFENCMNSGVVDLSTVRNENISHLKFINFHNLGAVYLNWDSMKESLKESPNIGNEGLIADEMKMLKENFHNQGYYDWEDETYVRYMNHHCNTLSPFKGTALKVFGMIGGYGTKPLRVSLWMFGIVLFFGFLYMAMGPQSITNSIDIYHYWSPFYYSAITFLTVGYGDLAARTGLAAILAGIEGFLGVFLMSYFSVSLVRKTLR